MRDAVLFAHADQIEELRMHGDEIHAERLVGQRSGRRDLRVEQLRRHRAAGDHAEAARIRYGGNQVALGHPAHRPAQDRGLAAQEIGASAHQLRSLGKIVHRTAIRRWSWMEQETLFVRE